MSCDDHSQENVKYLLQFEQLETIFDSSFWLGIEKLIANNVSNAQFTAFFSNNLNEQVKLNLHSFKPYNVTSGELNREHFHLCGRLLICSTKEDFLNQDKRTLLRTLAKDTWNCICDVSSQDTVDSNLEFHLCTMVMIIYFDNGNNCEFHFWTAYPGFCFPSNCYHLGGNHKLWSEYFTHQELLDIRKDLNKLTTKERLFFVLVKPSQGPVQVDQFRHFWSLENIESLNTGGDYLIIFCFSDPTSRRKYPGFLLRNYLAYIYVRVCQLLKSNQDNHSVIHFVKRALFSNALHIGSLRDWPRIKQVDGGDCFDHCTVYRLLLGSSAVKQIDSSDFHLDLFLENVNQKQSRIFDSKHLPPVIGWQRNAALNNRIVPFVVEYRSVCNPKVFHPDARPIHLYLMQPSNGQHLSFPREHCLVIGISKFTLDIVRTLLESDFQHITVATVQSSKPAAIFAQLKELENRFGDRIELNTVVLNLHVPNAESIQQLETLIGNHDTVFMLTSNHRCRWLITVISASKHKKVIVVETTPSGFRLLRHGVRQECSNQNRSLFDALDATALGCVFCEQLNLQKSDCETELKSTPLTAAAAGYALEMLFAILMHRENWLASAPKQSAVARLTPTALIAHQVVLDLAKHELNVLALSRAIQCSACCDQVIDAYRNGGIEFLLESFTKYSQV